jgi:hypothetical protein
VATVNLKNVSGEPLYLGRPDGLRIDDGQIIHVEGKLAPKADQPDDAVVVIEADGELRAYPTATWSVTADKSKSTPDVPAPSGENA